MIKRIKAEKIKAIKEKNDSMKTACNMILGEIPRLNKKEDQVTDSEIISIINKLIKSEITMLEYSGEDENENEYLNSLKSFLPKMLNESEIKEFLTTVDFTKLKNKMQAISIVKKEFGDKVDGNLVKQIVESW